MSKEDNTIGTYIQPSDDGFTKTGRWLRDREDDRTMAVIAEQVSETGKLKKVCKVMGWPLAAVRSWIDVDDGRRAILDTALRRSALAMMEDALDIADTPQLGQTVKILKDGFEEITKEDMLGHRKLQVSTRVTMARALDPSRFGDHSTVDLNQNITLNVVRFSELDVTPNADNPPE